MDYITGLEERYRALSTEFQQKLAAGTWDRELEAQLRELEEQRRLARHERVWAAMGPPITERLPFDDEPEPEPEPSQRGGRKLTMALAREIRERYAARPKHCKATEFQQELADEYGVGRTAIREIVNGHSWREEGETKPKPSRTRKLTKAQAMAIRTRYAQSSVKHGLQKELADEYGVSRQQICGIVNGQRWQEEAAQ
jgi:plasmid maintenance system antidote protein VapI